MTATRPAPASALGPGPVRIGLLLGYIAGTSGLGLAAAPIVSRNLADELGLATAQTAWVLGLFSLGLAVMTPVFGRLADLHGGRRVVLVATGCALAGTALVVVAPSLPVLLAGRALQGAASAGTSIVAFSIPAYRLAPVARARALGVLTALSALTLGAGPLFGAAAESVGGWRAALVLSVLMLLAAPALIRLAPPAQAGGGRRLDLVGAGLVLAVGAGGSVLLQARATDLSAPLVVGVAVCMAAAVVLLVRHVRAVPDGFLPRSVVRNGTFVRLSLAAAALMAGFLAMGFLAPLLLTEGTDRSSLAVGVILLPAAACAALTAHAVGVVRAHVPAERILVGLGAAAAGGMITAGVGADVAALVVVGAAAATSGFAGAQVVLLDRIAELVDPADRGIATGVFNLVFVTGGATGAALAGAVVDLASLGAAAVVCGAVAGLAAPIARAATRPAAA